MQSFYSRIFGFYKTSPKCDETIFILINFFACNAISTALADFDLRRPATSGKFPIFGRKFASIANGDFENIYKTVTK